MGYGEVDRISDLHDDLLGKIISRLPVKEAARTAALAHRWRHIWRSTPLVLDGEDLPEPTRAATIARVLADHPGPFCAVFIFIDSKFLNQSAAGWSRLLAAKGIQKLVFLDQTPTGSPARYSLPADILRCASLEHLFLAGWTLPDHLSRDTVVFSRLHALTLMNVDMSGQDLDYLLTASPILETLVLACPIKGFHLRSQKLRCALVFPMEVEEFSIVEAPLLERLILLSPPGYASADPVRIKIASTSNLRVLGYMEPRIHKLQINDNVIKPDTVASPSTVVPGIKILALKVNFSVSREVKMVASLIRCFPNVYTLHIQSVMRDPCETAYEPSGEDNAQFWQEASPAKFLTSQVKRMVFHNFRGNQEELEFLKSVARDAKGLQSLLLVSSREKVLSADEVNEMIEKLECPWFRAWTSKVLLVSPNGETDWCPVKASKLAVDDPFC